MCVAVGVCLIVIGTILQFIKWSIFKLNIDQFNENENDFSSYLNHLLCWIPVSLFPPGLLHFRYASHKDVINLDKDFLPLWNKTLNDRIMTTIKVQ